MSILEYLRKDLKLSAKMVFTQFPRYLSFTVVLLLISMLISSVSMLHYNHQKTQHAYLESRYVSNDGDVYHFQMIGLTQPQYLIVRQFDQEQTKTNEVFKIVGGIESSISGTQEKRYDLDIQLIGDIDQSFDTFVARYTYALDEISTNYTIQQTPLLDYELSVAKNTVIYLFLLALIVAAGSAAMWVLHSTMINHYKFTYGIYMSFGATFGRLFLAAFWEQFWIVLITWVPSSLASLAVSYAVFKQTGLPFEINFQSFLWALLLTLLCVAIAVFISIRASSAKTPSSLIIASDNSNLIHSPRVSYDLIGATFPGTVGKITYRRYWKYTLRLMAGTLSFSMLFVSAATIGNCYERVLAMDTPEISVSFDIPVVANEGESGESGDEESDGNPALTDESLSPDTTKSTESDSVPIDLSAYGYDAEKREVIASLDGIGTIVKRGYVQAMSIASHVKIDRSIPKLFSGGVYYGGISGDEKCFINVDFNALDNEVIDSFASLGYEVEGSLESVLSNEKTVAVTEGFMGAVKFDWKVGDKILIADRPTGAERAQLSAIAAGLMTADTDKLLTAWLQEIEFTYTEYTVGAILSEIPTDQNWGIYLSEDDFRQVTGQDAVYDELVIYCEPDATEEEVSALYYELRHIADYYTNMSVVDLDSATARTVERNKNYSSIITMISYVLLAVCPLIWFFSQSLFYQKRQQELELMQLLGAPTSAMKRYLLGDAVRFSLTGALLFALLAPIVSWLMHRLVGYIMIFMGQTMLASFKLPLIVYFAGILINLVCGLASGYLAWLSYKRSRSAIFSDSNRSQTNLKAKTAEKAETSIDTDKKEISE